MTWNAYIAYTNSLKICAHVCSCMCRFVCMSMCTCMWKTSINKWCFLWLTHTSFFWDMDSHEIMSSLIHLHWFSSIEAPEVCLHILGTEVYIHTAMPRFLHWFWGSELGSSSCLNSQHFTCWIIFLAPLTFPVTSRALVTCSRVEVPCELLLHCFT